LWPCAQNSNLTVIVLNAEELAEIHAPKQTGYPSGSGRECTDLLQLKGPKLKNTPSWELPSHLCVAKKTAPFGCTDGIIEASFCGNVTVINGDQPTPVGTAPANPAILNETRKPPPDVCILSICGVRGV
jgi:hypothetical protein